jgi:glutamyl-tRNA reductase
VILNRLLHQAFSVAKRVRSETGVAASAVSVSYAAVELAKRIFGNLADYQAMLLGAGEMAELAAVHLVNAGIKSIRVANRTRQRALDLAAQFAQAGGRAVPFEDLLREFTEVDIVISSTGAPGTVVNAGDLAEVMRRRKNRPMFFIDIAVPRDIDPAVNKLDNVYLYDIDDLREVVEENQAQRQGEALKGRAIVEEEAAAFMLWREQLSLGPTITELLAASESLTDGEVERTLRHLRSALSLTPEQEESARACLEAMRRSLVKKFNHRPINYLRRKFYEDHQRYDDQTAKPPMTELAEQLGLVRRIFGLDRLGLERDPGPRGPHGRKR